MTKTRILLGAAFLALIVAACAHDDPRFVGFFAPYKNCRARYAEIDARIDAAGVRDAGYYRVPGFPYLRTDRTLASFREEVHSLDDFSGWTRHMREYDQEAREFEYMNLGLSPQDAAILRFDMLTCGRGLASVELDDEATVKQLRAAAQPPDDYSDTARTLGAYPLAVPFLHSSVARHQAEVMQTFAKPLDQLLPPGPARLLQPKAVEDLSLVAEGYGKSIPDELGFPGLFDSAWRAMVEINAPALWIAGGGESDRPGVPVWTDSGVSVDTSQPVVYYQIGFTRFGSGRLAQIYYFVWFKGHGKAGSDIDGLIWRVTLDEKTRPLVYESLSASGRDHLWFPTTAVTPRGENGSYWREPELMPQAPLAAGPQALLLQAGTHALQRVVAVKGAGGATEKQEYELRRYEDLLALPRPDGSSRSLFDPHGMIPGTASATTDHWPYSSGVEDGLRQLGRHPTTLIGRVEFDDPYALEAIFVTPPSAPSPSVPSSSPPTGAP